jgi:hypothetical protein
VINRQLQTFKYSQGFRFFHVKTNLLFVARIEPIWFLATAPTPTAALLDITEQETWF